MPVHQWFVFDIGNVVIKLDYERMLSAVVEDSNASREEVIEVLGRMGGYHELEIGATNFSEFYEFLRARIQYSGSLDRLREVWSWILVGPVEGIEELICRVRRQYRVAFLSNTNELHAEQINRRFGVLFEEEDRFIFSHRYGHVKPDPALFQMALQVLGALPQQLIYVDDLAENVFAALDQGILTFRFTSALQLAKDLEEEGLLERVERPQSLIRE